MLHKVWLWRRPGCGNGSDAIARRNPGSRVTIAIRCGRQYESCHHGVAKRIQVWPYGGQPVGCCCQSGCTRAELDARNYEPPCSRASEGFPSANVLSEAPFNTIGRPSAHGALAGEPEESHEAVVTRYLLIQLSQRVHPHRRLSVKLQQVAHSLPWTAYSRRRIRRRKRRTHAEHLRAIHPCRRGREGREEGRRAFESLFIVGGSVQAQFDAVHDQRRVSQRCWCDRGSRAAIAQAKSVEQDAEQDIWIWSQADLMRLQHRTVRVSRILHGSYIQRPYTAFCIA